MCHADVCSGVVLLSALCIGRGLGELIGPSATQFRNAVKAIKVSANDLVLHDHETSQWGKGVGRGYRQVNCRGRSLHEF